MNEDKEDVSRKYNLARWAMGIIALCPVAYKLLGISDTITLATIPAIITAVGVYQHFNVKESLASMTSIGVKKDDGTP